MLYYDEKQSLFLQQEKAWLIIFHKNLAFIKNQAQKFKKEKQQILVKDNNKKEDKRNNVDNIFKIQYTYI